MNRRLCGCTFIYPGQTLEQGMALASGFGFRAVDISVCIGHTHWTVEQIIDQPAAIGEQVRTAADRFGLCVNEALMLNLGEPINHPDAAVRWSTTKRFPHVANFARAAGLRSLCVIPGPVHDAVGAEESFDLAIEGLDELARITVDHGVRLHVEADCDSCANTPALAMRLCDRLPDIFLTLDYSHFVYQGFDQDQVDPLFARAGHLHMRQAAPDRIATPVDDGAIDHARVLRAADAAGYDGLICVEYLQLPRATQLGMDCEFETRAMIDEMERLLK